MNNFIDALLLEGMFAAWLGPDLYPKALGAPVLGSVVRQEFVEDLKRLTR